MMSIKTARNYPLIYDNNRKAANPKTGSEMTVLLLFEKSNSARKMTVYRRLSLLKAL